MMSKYKHIRVFFVPSYESFHNVDIRTVLIFRTPAYTFDINVTIKQMSNADYDTVNNWLKHRRYLLHELVHDLKYLLGKHMKTIYIEKMATTVTVTGTAIHYHT